MRILALDIGSKTIGVALSDPLGLIAQGLTTIIRTDISEDIDKVIEIARDKNVQLIVVGKPINMNNSEGKSVQRVMNLANRIKDKSGIDLVYQDERLSTVAAEAVLIDSKVRRENRKKFIDKIAATYILQAYLDRRNNGNNRTN